MVVGSDPVHVLRRARIYPIRCHYRVQRSPRRFLWSGDSGPDDESGTDDTSGTDDITGTDDESDTHYDAPEHFSSSPRIFSRCVNVQPFYGNERTHEALVGPTYLNAEHHEWIRSKFARRVGISHDATCDNVEF